MPEPEACLVVADQALRMAPQPIQFRCGQAALAMKCDMSSELDFMVVCLFLAPNAEDRP